MALPIEELETRIGYRFRNQALLLRAVTHSSYSNETGARNHHLLCNERLEFLGDSVLSLISSNWLFSRYPELPEGDLTRMRAAMVCEEALASYSEKVNLGGFLLLGKGEAQSGGARKNAILADAFEAILAAMYLDAGMETVSAFLLPFLEEQTQVLATRRGYHADSKSRLQEFVQQDKEQKETLEYRLVEEKGPDHDKTFTVEVYLGANCVGHGVGHSKKHAEQAAATAALQLFGQV